MGGDVLDSRPKASRVKQYLIYLSILALLVGCKGGVDKTLEQVVEENYHLEATGTLHIKNEDGSVRLYGSDAAELHIKAIKRAYSRERLQAISVRVISQAESASIETVSPPGIKWSLRDRSGTVDYIIVIPQHLQTIDLELVNGEISIDGLRGGKAKANAINGRISARNCFANLDYNTKNGAIDFYYNWWEPAQYLIKAEIPNGAIGVFLPRSASFHLEAETKGGGISTNVLEQDEAKPGHRKQVMATIGSEPGPRFQLHAVKGNIRIHAY
jgi:hypothetical protein